ncbi:hypothetical protein [Ensifer sp. OTU672]|uniref:hypothetical protein n=1 Tax=Ensifer sp. OTU672 TaxID=3043861 RepID=UPI00313CA609
MGKEDLFVSHLPHLTASAPVDVKWLIRFDELFARHDRRQARRLALRHAVAVAVWLFFAILVLLLLVK